MGTFQMKSSPGFSSRVREKFHRPTPLRNSFVFVEDKSRKYDFVDNENANWTPKSPLVDRQKLQQSDESQLRLACKLLSERIDRGETAPERTTSTANKKNNSTATTSTTTTTTTTASKKTDSLRHFNTRSDESTSADTAEETARKRHSMPVISEMLRGLETGLEIHGEGAEPETSAIPQQQQQQHEATTQQKTRKTITQIQNDDDNAPQHIEEYDPLTSIPTVPDDAASLDRRKTSLMRRISFFAFGKRKTSGGLGHYQQHNKGAMAVK